MSFTTVPTFTPGQVVTATDLNTYIRDNEGYLLNRPSQIILRDNNANYTYNVAGTYAAIDGTNLAITLNFSGSLAYVWFQAVVSHSVIGYVDFDFTYDGNRVGVAGVDGLYAYRAPGAGAVGGIYYAALVAVTSGSHTFKPVWSVVTAGTITAYAGANAGGTDWLPQFGVMEVA